jgi:hypothetical protein
MPSSGNEFITESALPGVKVLTATALLTIGEKFADILSNFADAVASRIDLVTEDAQGSA